MNYWIKIGYIIFFVFLSFSFLSFSFSFTVSFFNFISLFRPFFLSFFAILFNQFTQSNVIMALSYKGATVSEAE